MNYIISNMAEIIKNKMEEKKKIVLWLSAQINCCPHIGALTNFILAFALAKHSIEYYNVPVRIKIEILESVTGEEFIIDEIKYYKNLNTITDKNELTIKEK